MDKNIDAEFYGGISEYGTNQSITLLSASYNTIGQKSKMDGNKTRMDKDSFGLNIKWKIAMLNKISIIC